MLRFLVLAGVLFGPLAAMNAQANDATVEMLRKLANAPGPPGADEPVRAVIYPVLNQNSSTIRFDGVVVALMGSLTLTTVSDLRNFTPAIQANEPRMPQ